MAKGRWGADPRLWGEPTYGVVTSAHPDGSVLIRTVSGHEFGGRYAGLEAGDVVLIYTGDFWSPVKITGKVAEDIKAVHG